MRNSLVPAIRRFALTLLPCALLAAEAPAQSRSSHADTLVLALVDDLEPFVGKTGVRVLSNRADTSKSALAVILRRPSSSGHDVILLTPASARPSNIRRAVNALVALKRQERGATPATAATLVIRGSVTPSVNAYANPSDRATRNLARAATFANRLATADMRVVDGIGQVRAITIPVSRP